MNISVVLCTYNRAGIIGKALDSILASIVPPDIDWEILVVDNNSADATKEVVSTYCARYSGRVRYTFAAEQGLSNARNAGINDSRATVIAFTDDDITVEPDWLWKLASPLLRDDGVAGVGGRVCPPHDFVRPAWLALDGSAMDSSGVLAIFDQGSTPGELKKSPFGANMAYRRSVFAKYGGFRPDLGRSGANLLSNEDTEFGERLMKAGERLAYEPSAVVHHPISKERLSKDYFLAWWYAHGQATFRQHGARASIYGIPRPYVSIAWRIFKWIFSFDAQTRFYWKTRVWAGAGEIAESHSGRASRGKEVPVN